MLEDGDLFGFNEALQLLYGPNEERVSFASRVCAFLRKLVPGEQAVVGSLNRRTGVISLYSDCEHPQFDQAMSAYGEHMNRYRYFSWDPSVSDGQPYFLSDYISLRNFRSTGMYSDVFRIMDLDNHCSVLIPGTERSVDFVGIERRRGPDFSEKERFLLKLAQPNLATARELARCHVENWHRGARAESLVKRGLSNREADVLYWISEGKSNDEIATLLGIKLLTVKGYAKTIFQKLGVANRLGAALWAIRATMDDRLNPDCRTGQHAKIIAGGESTAVP